MQAINLCAVDPITGYCQKCRFTPPVNPDNLNETYCKEYLDNLRRIDDENDWDEDSDFDDLNDVFNELPITLNWDD